MNKKEKIILTLVFLFAFGLRIWNVDNHPTFISDEASIGYNTYSILKTSRDEWGKFLPLSFKAFGEYKLPVYIYMAVPFVGIFGLNELAVRMPSVFFGSLTGVFLFFLVKELRGKKNSILPLVASFFLAILPWHIELSRMALEANLALFLAVLGLFLWEKGKKKSLFFYFSFLSFAVSLYTYNACRVFVPLLVGGLVFAYRKEKGGWKKLILPGIFVIFLLLPLAIGGFRGTGERLEKVGIFTNPGILAQINEKRATCLETKREFICRLFYNRPVFYSLIFVRNYLSHFSLNFLFLKGAGLAQYGVPGRGGVYFWQLPLIILGILWFFQKERKVFWFLLCWAAISPLANSFTGQAHPVRAIFLLLVIPILAAAGTMFLWEKIGNKKIKRGVFGGIILLSFVGLGNFLHDYFILYPQVHTSTWQEGYKPLFEKLADLEKDYEKILVTKFYGEPHIFYLFYQKYDPKNYQEEKEVVRYDREDKWVNVDRIGKYYFVDDWQKEILKLGQLVAIAPHEVNFEIGVLERIKYKDGETAFIIGKIIK